MTVVTLVWYCGILSAITTSLTCLIYHIFLTFYRDSDIFSDVVRLVGSGLCKPGHPLWKSPKVNKWLSVCHPGRTSLLTLICVSINKQTTITPPPPYPSPLPTPIPSPTLQSPLFPIPKLLLQAQCFYTSKCRNCVNVFFYKRLSLFQQVLSIAHKVARSFFYDSSFLTLQPWLVYCVLCHVS